MEYLYGDSSTPITEHCSFCSNKGWTSPVPMKHIPQPVPDPENPTHFNPFAPGDFAEKRVLKLVEWFSGHCRAIKS